MAFGLLGLLAFFLYIFGGEYGGRICGAAWDYGYRWRGRWAGEPDGWTAWFEAAKCVAILICFMSGLGYSCSLICLGVEKIKGVESLRLGLGLRLRIEGYM